MIYLLLFFLTTLPLQSMEKSFRDFRDFPIQRSKSDKVKEKRKSMKLKKSTSSADTTSSSTSSSHSLSPSVKPKREKIALPKLKKSSSSSSPSSSTGSYGSLSSSLQAEKEATIVDTLPIEHPFIEAISNKKHPQIVYFLKNRNLDPNVYGLNGKAAIHIAAKLEDYYVIKLLLDDYRTDFSQQTKSKKFITHYISKSAFIASQLNLEKQIPNGELELEKQKLETEKQKLETEKQELLHDIFARFNLDMVTNEACSRSLFYLTKNIEENNIPEAIFKDMISKIKNKILKDESNQFDNKKNNFSASETKKMLPYFLFFLQNYEIKLPTEIIKLVIQTSLEIYKNDNNDREIPKKACFPQYATDVFMKDKIEFILKLFAKKTTT
jgi:hypothetical protein